MFLLLITSRIAIRLFSFNKILLFIKKLAFDGFYPLVVLKKKIDFCCCLKKKKKKLKDSMTNLEDQVRTFRRMKQGRL